MLGHLCHLEGCRIESFVTIGSGSVVLHRAVVRSGALVGANAVVTGGTEVPAGAMALGIPARIREGAVDPEVIRHGVEAYVHRARTYPSRLRRIG